MRRHPLFGIAASALAAPTGFFIYGVASGIGTAGFDLRGIALAGLVVYCFELLVSVPASLAFGLPYVLWLQRHGRLGWANVCVASTVLGALVFCALWLLAYQDYQPLYVFGLLGAACGLASGLAFCVVVRPGSPSTQMPPGDSA